MHCFRERCENNFAFLEKIIAELRFQREMLVNLMAQLRVERGEADCPDDIHLPLDTIPDLDIVEEKLQDSVTLKMLVCYTC